MQGYTDHVFRVALHRCFDGVDMMFTPFMRLEGGALRSRDSREWLSGNLVGISINLCKSKQKEFFINDTP